MNMLNHGIQHKRLSAVAAGRLNGNMQRKLLVMALLGGLSLATGVQAADAGPYLHGSNRLTQPFFGEAQANCDQPTQSYPGPWYGDLKSGDRVDASDTNGWVYDKDKSPSGGPIGFNACITVKTKEMISSKSLSGIRVDDSKGSIHAKGMTIIMGDSGMHFGPLETGVLAAQGGRVDLSDKSVITLTDKLSTNTAVQANNAGQISLHNTIINLSKVNGNDVGVRVKVDCDQQKPDCIQNGKNTKITADGVTINLNSPGQRAVVYDAAGIVDNKANDGAAILFDGNSGININADNNGTDYSGVVVQGGAKKIFASTSSSGANEILPTKINIASSQPVAIDVFSVIGKESTLTFKDFPLSKWLSNKNIIPYIRVGGGELVLDDTDASGYRIETIENNAMLKNPNIFLKGSSKVSWLDLNMLNKLDISQHTGPVYIDNLTIDPDSMEEVELGANDLCTGSPKKGNNIITAGTGRIFYNVKNVKDCH